MLAQVAVLWPRRMTETGAATVLAMSRLSLARRGIACWTNGTKTPSGTEGRWISGM